jgi:hypothetical protein
MAVKLNFVIAVWKFIRVLNFTPRIRDASGSRALVRLGRVPFRFDGAATLMSLSYEHALKRHSIFR